MQQFLVTVQYETHQQGFDAGNTLFQLHIRYRIQFNNLIAPFYI